MKRAMWGLSGPKGLWEGDGDSLLAAYECTCGLGPLVGRARRVGAVGSLGAARNVGGGWGFVGCSL